LKKALLFLLFGLLALVLTAAVAIYLVVKLALAPSPGEWPTRVEAGPFSLEVGVPTAIRLATSSWFAPWLAGRTIDTEHGPVRFGWWRGHHFGGSRVVVRPGFRGGFHGGVRGHVGPRGHIGGSRGHFSRGFSGHAGGRVGGSFRGHAGGRHR